MQHRRAVGSRGLEMNRRAATTMRRGTLMTTTATTTTSAIATVMRTRGEDPDRTMANGTDGEGTLTVMRRGTLIATMAGP